MRLAVKSLCIFMVCIFLIAAAYYYSGQAYNLGLVQGVASFGSGIGYLRIMDQQEDVSLIAEMASRQVMADLEVIDHRLSYFTLLMLDAGTANKIKRHAQAVIDNRDLLALGSEDVERVVSLAENVIAKVE